MSNGFQWRIPSQAFHFASELLQQLAPAFEEHIVRRLREAAGKGSSGQLKSGVERWPRHLTSFYMMIQGFHKGCCHGLAVWSDCDVYFIRVHPWGCACIPSWRQCVLGLACSCSDGIHLEVWSNKALPCSRRWAIQSYHVSAFHKPNLISQTNFQSWKMDHMIMITSYTSTLYICYSLIILYHLMDSCSTIIPRHNILIDFSNWSNPKYGALAQRWSPNNLSNADAEENSWWVMGDDWDLRLAINLFTVIIHYDVLVAIYYIV